MGLKERLKEKSASLVERELVTLPRSREVVRAKCLMSGEQLRCGAAKPERQPLLFIALGTEDPETGKPLWNPNSLDDIESIEALHGDDMKAILDTVRRLSGMDPKAAEDDAKNSEGTLSSSFSSASDTESSPPSLAVA